jgi:hypothetical protein
MGSVATIHSYIPGLIKVGSGIQKLIKMDSQTHRQHDDLVSLLSLSQNKESKLKRVMRLTMHWTRSSFSSKDVFFSSV